MRGRFDGLCRPVLRRGGARGGAPRVSGALHPEAENRKKTEHHVRVLLPESRLVPGRLHRRGPGRAGACLPRDLRHPGHPGGKGAGAQKPPSPEKDRGRGEPGQSRQDGLPLPHEPRHPHAAQRHHRHDLSHEGDGAGARGPEESRQDRHLLQIPALPHQRRAGHVEGGERQDRAAPGAV